MRRLFSISSTAAAVSFRIALTYCLVAFFGSAAIADEPARVPARVNVDGVVGAAPASTTENPPRFVVETVRGRVVFLGEAMQRLAGVKTVDEARERTLALETADGQLLPLLEDVRGRGFRNDPRLRSYELELIVRRYRGSPFLQTLRVYSVEKPGKFELDYWCDVCAIAMYELKPCECCQGDTEFRRRPVRAE
jgi:hypothetical protein